MGKISSLLLVSFAVFVAKVRSDTPANCTYEEVKGTWMFQIGKGGHDRTLNCSKQFTPETKTKIVLSYPDVATDDYGNKGFWTIIYNQGFEVVIHGRKYFAFSKYAGTGENTTSFCDQTQQSMGWSHDILGNDWSCFEGHKVERLAPKKTYVLTHRNGKQLYGHNPEYIKAINQAQKLWTAAHYPEYEQMTLDEMVRRAGGPMSRIHSRPAKMPLAAAQKPITDLPDSFDWRNVKEVDYVSPVRNQGGCGSCYAFSSAGMNEARMRVVTNNTEQPVFSPQDVVDCSEYSQGCEGGFPYLIGGKYSEDFGMVSEQCNPYTGKESHTGCTTPKTCGRNYATIYKYVGGYYGACTEELMKQELVANGPMSVSFEVYDDFFNYKSGVYTHTGLNAKFNPFHITNHAVLLVGYGLDEDTMTPYWIVKNSWGESWGEKGYFRIKRGNDECSIESIAVASYPVF